MLMAYPDADELTQTAYIQNFLNIYLGDETDKRALVFGL
jgi:hypothetical protein